MRAAPGSAAAAVILVRSKRKVITKALGEKNTHFVFQVGDVDWMYGFSARSFGRDPDPFFEHFGLCLRGTFSPTVPEANRMEVALTPHRRLNELGRKTITATEVGVMTLDRGKLKVRLFAPSEALVSILQMTAAGYLRYVLFESTRLHYREARVLDYSLRKNPLPDVDDT
jgi:hypothetical protein